MSVFQSFEESFLHTVFSGLTKLTVTEIKKDFKISGSYYSHIYRLQVNILPTGKYYQSDKKKTVVLTLFVSIKKTQTKVHG